MIWVNIRLWHQFWHEVLVPHFDPAQDRRREPLPNNCSQRSEENVVHFFPVARNSSHLNEVYRCLCLRTENRSRKTHVFEYRDCGVGWGGVGGYVNVPCTSYMIYCHAAKISGIIYYVTCCYAAEISGIVYYVTCRYAAEISGIVYYVTYMLLPCWDLWDRLLRYIHVATLLRSLGSFTTLHTCCYAAEISGIVYYVTCCYAAEISGIVYYVTCRYAAEISGIVYYVTYMLLRCWDLWDLWELGNGDAFTRMLTASCLLRMCCSDDAEKRKNAPQVFPGFPIIKLARHCGKITIFFKKWAFYGNGFRSGGMFIDDFPIETSI